METIQSFDALGADPRREGVRGQAGDRPGKSGVEDNIRTTDAMSTGMLKWRDSAPGPAAEFKRARRKSSLPEIVIGEEGPDEGLKRWTPLALDAMARANKPEPSPIPARRAWQARQAGRRRRRA
jgi:hypothetical protein